MPKALSMFAIPFFLWSSSAIAEFRLSPEDENKEVAFCKSLPRPAAVGPNVPINDYCGCWIGSAELGWTQQEYSQWKAAAQGQGKMTSSLSAKASDQVRQCVAVTTPAR